MSRIDSFYTQEQMEQALVGEQKQPEPDIREKAEEQEQNKVKEAEVIKPTISSKCAGYLNLIKSHIDKGNEEGLKNARSFFANKVEGLTDDELDMCRQAVEEGIIKLQLKK